MPGYINPIELIASQLQPLSASVNTGIDQGLKLGTLQAAIAKEKMMQPYYQAHSALYNATANEKGLAAQRLNDALGRVRGDAGGGTIAPTGSLTPQQLIDYHLLGITKPELLQPVDTPVADAGGVMRTVRGGASTFVPTVGLPAKQTPHNVISGDQEQSILVDRSGQTSPLMLPGTAPENQAPAGLKTADPGPRFKEPVEKDKWGPVVPGPGGSFTQKNLTTGQVHPVIGREPKGSEDSGIAKSANLSAMRTILAARFLPVIPAEKRSLTAGLFTTDQFGTSVNPARLRDALPEDQQRKWDRVSIKAAENALTMSPEAAVEKAINDDLAAEATRKTTQTGKKPLSQY